jgi:hypothetical protein
MLARCSHTSGLLSTLAVRGCFLPPALHGTRRARTLYSGYSALVECSRGTGALPRYYSTHGVTLRCAADGGWGGSPKRHSGCATAAAAPVAWTLRRTNATGAAVLSR